jgi:hypothetical protein
VARAPLERPTDAPPIAHVDEADASAGTTFAMEAPPLVPPQDLPRHVAIIMDGNRRWARNRGLAELDGHAAGVEAIRALLKHVVRRGVPVLSLYAFSRENWARSDDEVNGLFGLLEQAIRSETAELKKEGVRIRLLGRLDELPDETRRSPPPSMRPRAASGSSSTSRSITPAGPRSSTPSGAWPRAVSPPTRSTSTRSRTRSTRRAYPIQTSSSGLAASSACRISSSGNPPTPSSTRATCCGPTLAPRPSTPPSSSSLAALVVSDADRSHRSCSASAPSARPSWSRRCSSS